MRSFTIITTKNNYQLNQYNIQDFFEITQAITIVFLMIWYNHIFSWSNTEIISLQIKILEFFPLGYYILNRYNSAKGRHFKYFAWHILLRNSPKCQIGWSGWPIVLPTSSYYFTPKHLIKHCLSFISTVWCLGAPSSCCHRLYLLSRSILSKISLISLTRIFGIPQLSNFF